MMIMGQDIRIRRGILKVAYLDAESYRFLPDAVGMIAFLKEKKRFADVFTFTQRLSCSAPEFPYYYELANYAVLDITSYDEWWNKTIGFKARNKARQAEKKGVVLKEVKLSSEVIAGVHAIYQETPIRQGRSFPHFGKPIKQVENELSTYADSSIFIGAYYSDKMIGIARLVLDDRAEQAGLMTIVSMLAHRDKAPTNALVAKAVEVCADRKVKKLFYSSYAYGNLSRDSLTEFKERNGFVRLEVPRYFVPLSVWGAIALKIGLHHRLIDRLPESISMKLREWRRKYNEKNHA